MEHRQGHRDKGKRAETRTNGCVVWVAEFTIEPEPQERSGRCLLSEALLQKLKEKKGMPCACCLRASETTSCRFGSSGALDPNDRVEKSRGSKIQGL